MQKFLARIKALGSKALSLVRKVWTKEPARVVSIAAAAVVFVAAKLGIAVPTQTVADALAYAIPILLGGELIRSQVSPVASPPSTPKP